MVLFGFDPLQGHTAHDNEGNGDDDASQEESELNEDEQFHVGVCKRVAAVLAAKGTTHSYCTVLNVTCNPFRFLFIASF